MATTTEGAMLAAARDRWMGSDEGLDALDGCTDGQYLRNRLEHAYIAGWHGLAHALQHTQLRVDDLALVIYDGDDGDGTD
jgi:hypothetical protein